MAPQCAPRARALVDSGCDVTSFPAAWAEELGIDLSDCPAFAGVTAAGKDRLKRGDAGLGAGPPASICTRVSGQKIHLEAVFRPGLPILLLGREDFFTYFKVSFDQKAKLMRLQGFVRQVRRFKLRHHPAGPRLRSRRMGSGVAALIVASNSGHASWWIGLPVLAVVLVFGFGFWESQQREGRVAVTTVHAGRSDDRDDKQG